MRNYNTLEESQEAWWLNEMWDTGLDQKKDISRKSGENGMKS